jgi:hypothetical protein
MFDPPSHSHGDIYSNQETVIAFKIYSMQAVPMNLGSGQTKDSVLSKKVKVEVGEEREIKPGEFPEMADARRMVECTVRLDRGLPAGPLNLDINIARREEGEPDDTEFLTYNIRGRVVTPVRIIAGDDYNETRNILNLGAAKTTQGLKKSIMMAIRTEDAGKDPNLRIGKIVPEQVKATVGTPKISATQRIYPLTLELPAGTEPIELDGTFSKDFGKIVLETDMESSPTIPIFLKFRLTE